MKINFKEMHGYLIAKSLKFEGKIAELCRRGEVYATDIAADSSRIGGRNGNKFPPVVPLAIYLGDYYKAKRGSLPATEGIALFQRSLSSALLPPIHTMTKRHCYEL